MKRGIGVRERALGNDHYSVAHGYIELAEVYTMMGKYDAAESLLQQALSIQHQVLDSSHPDIGYTVLALGRQYRFQHQNEEAVDMFQRAIIYTTNVW